MLATVIGWTISIHSYWLEKGILPTDHTPCEEQLWVDSVEKVALLFGLGQNHSIGQRENTQHDGTVIEWAGAAVLLVQH
ncbi:hypothetical protein [Pseudomonas sp. CDFA 610]|uniref:hypothetical protein n=1 Tax=Pseudomonas sp. CDFA 610 TaxID=2829825 RepID=UPI001E420018|nr:hypothetical protein [Pseudomonas sp. CDFA 610]MCD5981904.1 hypothetical protein [Pseudomonas sp. CDFA 610]